ncbi:MAG TPA: hypothetical protein VNO55_12830 [Polyangia bacterium]|nr:hypothetical protein [Polyangia bacterium]
MKHHLLSSNALAIQGALVLATLAVAGCGPDFAPYERLTSLRILAVKSEPVAPAPGQTTTLSALVYTPPPADPAAAPPAVSYEWSWCPFVGTASAGYPCLITADQIPAMGGAPVSFDLGTGETASLPHNFDPQLLMAICNGMPGFPPPPDCREGFPVTVRVTVRTDSDQVTAVRPLKLLLAAPTAENVNTNPTIDGLLATVAGQDKPLDTMIELLRRADNPIKAVVKPEMAQVYDGFDDEGKPAPMSRERLYLSWFVESGDLKFPRTSFNSTTTIPFDELLKNTWRPATTKDYPRHTAMLYVVLRDSRDGVGWLPMPGTTVNLGAAP